MPSSNAFTKKSASETSRLPSYWCVVVPMPINFHDTTLKSRPDQLSSSPMLPTRSLFPSPALSRSTLAAQPAAPNTPMIAERHNELVDRNIDEPPGGAA